VNPYEVLGVAVDAPVEEIHRAYLRIARRFHPDFFSDASPRERGEAEERMRAANEAWAVLGDPERRRALDAAAPPRPFRPFSPVDDEPDPRDAPDVPYRPAPPPSGRDRATTLAPVLLFAASVVIGVVGSFMRLSGVIALAFVLFALACLGFLVVPLLALSRARHDEG
jgi:curved DNA-binding protein CbpA